MFTVVTLVNTHTFLGFSIAISIAAINKEKKKERFSCFDFLLLKPMLKKRGCVRTPGSAPSGLGCRHHKHMSTGDKYTMNFSGSSGRPVALLAKK